MDTNGREVKTDWSFIRVNSRLPAERCLACEAGRSETWWGEAPERPKGFTGGEVLKGLAGPGYI
jgi:hypothetical protein